MFFLILSAGLAHMNEERWEKRGTNKGLIARDGRAGFGLGSGKGVESGHGGCQKALYRQRVL